jgi:hypothetical protein
MHGWIESGEAGEQRPDPPAWLQGRFLMVRPYVATAAASATGA